MFFALRFEVSKQRLGREPSGLAPIAAIAVRNDVRPRRRENRRLKSADYTDYADFWPKRGVEPVGHIGNVDVTTFYLCVLFVEWIIKPIKSLERRWRCTKNLDADF